MAVTNDTLLGPMADGHLKKAGKVTIIGAGPAGLATAIMLARRGYVNIQVRMAFSHRKLFFKDFTGKTLQKHDGMPNINKHVVSATPCMHAGI